MCSGASHAWIDAFTARPGFHRINAICDDAIFCFKVPLLRADMFKRNPFVSAEDRIDNFVEVFSQHPTARTLSFQPGDLLRQKGVHYRDMLLVIHGVLEIDFETENASPKLQISEPGTPIGEIGFLRGTAANATVRANSDAAAIMIDDDVLERLEKHRPNAASQFLHHLAQIAEERTSFNLLTTSRGPTYSKGQKIEILICRTEDMLKRAQRLRYDVYCGELGRQSPYADHAARLISDDLDRFANTFVAIEDGEIIGTLRSSEAAHGSLGILEELYGMNKSAHHPKATAVCTKFVVRKSRRGGPTAFKLIAAVVKYGLQRQVKECYVDCIPSLLPYYQAMGFVSCGERFLHRENGPSDPLVLDIEKYGKRLTTEMGPLSLAAFFVRSQYHKMRLRLSKP
jgi:CRP-like cAMP-binding protein/predicted GNAT family N-acyltransferase